MSRLVTLVKKDIRRSARSSLSLLVLGYPILLTLMVQGLFGSILNAPPRVGYVDGGSSVIAARFIESKAMDTRRYEDPDVMWQDVTSGEIDVGFQLPASFDDHVRAGTKPLVESHVSAGAQPTTLLKVHSLFAVALEELTPDPPVDVQLVRASEEKGKSWVERLMPMLILLSLMIGGTFLTGVSFVDEKTKGTLRAVLASPASLTEILLAKSVIGLGAAVLSGTILLLINGMMTIVSPALVAGLVVGGVMLTEIGLLIGLVSKSQDMLYGIVKGLGMLLLISVLPSMWDAVPMWVGQLVPTYWAVAPILAVANEGAGLADIGAELGIASAICVGLALLVGVTARKVGIGAGALQPATHG